VEHRLICDLLDYNLTCTQTRYKELNRKLLYTMYMYCVKKAELQQFSV